MATRILDGWASWKTPKNWVMALSRPNRNSASAARVQRNPFIYARKLKIATDLLGQKRDVTWRHRRNWANNTGEP
jgi:hypothetical protein